MKRMIIIVIAALLIFSACDATSKEASSQDTSDKQEVTQEQKPAANTVEEDEQTPEQTPESTPEPEPLPNKVAVVVCRDGYAPSEFHPVVDALADAGYEAVITSDELGEANGFEETVEVTATFNDFTGSDLRGIVVIGGSESLWENADIHRLLNEVNDLERVTAGICLNSVTLAKAGVIKEGETACWANSDTLTDPVMAEMGVIDSGKLVTVNGNVITGNGPPAAKEFASEIVKALDAM